MQHSKPDYFLACDVDHMMFRRCRWILPPMHDYDHRALVVKLSTDVEVVKRYTRRRQRTPFRKVTEEEMTEEERMFETLKEAVDPSQRREMPKNLWTRGGIWELIDHRAQMRREGPLTQEEGRKLGRRIKAALKADRIERA